MSRKHLAEETFVALNVRVPKELSRSLKSAATTGRRPRGAGEVLEGSALVSA